MKLKISRNFRTFAKFHYFLEILTLQKTIEIWKGRY